MASQPARHLGTSPTPFADAALELHGHGLAVIPLNENADKAKPLVKFKHWKLRPGRQFLEETLINRFPAANIGVLTGLSGYTVVDIDTVDGVDTAALTDRMLARFGDTPLKTATPSGGVHLWFMANGEPCRNLRASDGIAVDIKAKGGMVVVPPSIRPSGPHAGRVYGFLEGSWDDLRRLPTLKPGSFYEGNGGRVVQGTRNDTLWKRCMHQVRHCDTVDDLLDVARTFNTHNCVPELPDAEVVNTARSAWKYQQDGKNWVGGPSQVVLPADDIDRFRMTKNGADAFLLQAVLKCKHGGRHEPFALVATAMKHDNVIHGWGRDRYRNAFKTLMTQGDLERVHVGGNTLHDPHKYRLRPVTPKASQY